MKKKMQLAGFIGLAFLSACTQPGPPAAVRQPWYPAANENGDSVSAVFEGRIPCAEPGFVGCDKVKVALVLYRDNPSKALAAYRLGRVYVAEKPEGSRIEIAGAAVMARGTQLDANAAVLQLDEKAPPGFRSYWAVGDSILFLLDGDRKPKVGTAGWSYVLNRTR